MATSIATGALRPRTAVALSAVLNLVGAFLSVEVAKTISGGITLTLIASGSLAAGSGPPLWVIISAGAAPSGPSGACGRRDRAAGRTPRDQGGLMHVNWAEW